MIFELKNHNLTSEVSKALLAKCQTVNDIAQLLDEEFSEEADVCKEYFHAALNNVMTFVRQTIPLLKAAMQTPDSEQLTNLLRQVITAHQQYLNVAIDDSVLALVPSQPAPIHHDDIDERTDTILAQVAHYRDCQQLSDRLQQLKQQYADLDVEFKGLTQQSKKALTLYRSMCSVLTDKSNALAIENQQLQQKLTETQAKIEEWNDERAAMTLGMGNQ